MVGEDMYRCLSQTAPTSAQTGMANVQAMEEGSGETQPGFVVFCSKELAQQQHLLTLHIYKPYSSVMPWQRLGKVKQNIK